MSILSQVQGLPGMRAAKESVHRVVSRGGHLPAVLPSGNILAGACSRDPGNDPVTRLRAGMLLGMIDTVVNSLGAAGQYAPSILGVTTNAEAVGSTSIQAAAGVITELVRRRGSTGTFNLIGPGSAGGIIVKELVTYSAASGTNITVTAISNNFIAGSFICPTDGSEEPLTVLNNGFPYAVTDSDGSNVTVEIPALNIGCILDSSELLPVWPSDVALQGWIMSRLNRNGGGMFQFDHLYTA